MAHVLRIALVDPQEATRRPLAQSLAELADVWLVAECWRYEDSLDAVRQSEADVLFVQLDADANAAIQLVAALTGPESRCDVVGVTNQQDGKVLLQAMRAGFREFLTWPVQASELVQLLTRLRSSRTAGTTRTEPSKLVSVAGAAGGVGSTTVAVNLAHGLAAHSDRQVVLVDLNLALGDAHMCLDLKPEFTLSDVTRNVHRLDLSLLRKSLAKHSSGLYVLARPRTPEEVEHIRVDDVRRVLSLLKAAFTHVIVDVSKSYGAADWAALDMSDLILLVTRLDVACLGNVVRVIGRMRGRPGGAETVKVVVNQSGWERNEIPLEKAEQTIGQEFAWKIPDDSRRVTRARNQGTPLAEFAGGSKVEQVIAQLGRFVVHGKQGATKPARAKGIFSFLF